MVHNGPVRHVVPVPGWDGGNADAAYLDKTLRYGDIEAELDESVSGRALFRIWWRAAVAGWAVFIFFGFLATFGFLAALGSGTGPNPGLVVIGMILSFVVFWVVLLAVRVPEPIAEWRVLLTDRAGSATATYSQIAGSLRARRMPINYEVKPVNTGSPRDGVRYRLLLRENFYVAYVSVFAYGTSLYLGWMMWRTRRGGQLVLQFLVDMVGGMLGRTDPELLMLRTERPRAMREAVHSSCREGLFVAYEQRPVPLEFGFPNPGERSQIPDAPHAGVSPFGQRPPVSHRASSRPPTQPPPNEAPFPPHQAPPQAPFSPQHGNMQHGNMQPGNPEPQWTPRPAAWPPAELTGPGDGSDPFFGR
jgi:hypothetical protein